MGDVVKMFQEEYAPGTGGTEILAFAKYHDLEKAADRTAAKIKEGFMEMGYILKVARDTDILAGSGYASHEEFAEKRYGLDKGTVSRYIRIVERFSVGGNSHMLQEGYKNIGFAKLSLMLHMPDAIAEEITASYSKQEVQEIKEEIDAERAVSDIEVAIEDAGVPEEEKTGSLLERTLHQLGREQPEIYRKLHGASRKETGLLPVILEILAPQGDAIYMVRIPGTGRLMLSISGESASVTNVRSGEKERYAPEDIQAAALGIMHGASVGESWQQEYGEPMEPVRESLPQGGEKKPGGKEKVAPVQPKEKRKESKVTKAAPPEAKKAAKVSGEEVPPAPLEEQLPGQMEVMDYQEAIPDAHFEEITEGMPMEGLPATAGGERPGGGADPAGETEKGMEGTGTGRDPGAGDGTTAGHGDMEGKVPEPDALPGAAPGGGCEADPFERVKGQSHKEVWVEIQDAAGSLSRFIWRHNRMHPGLIQKEALEAAYSDAVNVAAAIEKLMDISMAADEGRDGDGEEHHAQ